MSDNEFEHVYNHNNNEHEFYIRDDGDVDEINKYNENFLDKGITNFLRKNNSNVLIMYSRYDIKAYYSSDFNFTTASGENIYDMTYFTLGMTHNTNSLIIDIFKLFVCDYDNFKKLNGDECMLNHFLMNNMFVLFNIEAISDPINIYDDYWQEESRSVYEYELVELASKKYLSENIWIPVVPCRNEAQNIMNYMLNLHLNPSIVSSECPIKYIKGMYGHEVDHSHLDIVCLYDCNHSNTDIPNIYRKLFNILSSVSNFDNFTSYYCEDCDCNITSKDPITNPLIPSYELYEHLAEHFINDNKGDADHQVCECCRERYVNGNPIDGVHEIDDIDRIDETNDEIDSDYFLSDEYAYIYDEESEEDEEEQDNTSNTNNNNNTNNTNEQNDGILNALVEFFHHSDDENDSNESDNESDNESNSDDESDDNGNEFDIDYLMNYRDYDELNNINNYESDFESEYDLDSDDYMMNEGVRCPVDGCNRIFSSAERLGEHFIRRHADYNTLVELDKRTGNYPGLQVLKKIGMVDTINLNGNINNHIDDNIDIDNIDISHNLNYEGINLISNEICCICMEEYDRLYYGTVDDMVLHNMEKTKKIIDTQRMVIFNNNLDVLQDMVKFEKLMDGLDSMDRLIYSDTNINKIKYANFTDDFHLDLIKTSTNVNNYDNNDRLIRHPLKMMCCGQLICSVCLSSNIKHTDAFECVYCKHDHCKDSGDYIVFDERQSDKIESNRISDRINYIIENSTDDVPILNI